MSKITGRKSGREEQLARHNQFGSILLSRLGVCAQQHPPWNFCPLCVITQPAVYSPFPLHTQFALHPARFNSFSCSRFVAEKLDIRRGEKGLESRRHFPPSSEKSPFLIYIITGDLLFSWYNLLQNSSCAQPRNSIIIQLTRKCHQVSFYQEFFFNHQEIIKIITMKLKKSKSIRNDPH